MWHKEDGGNPLKKQKQPKPSSTDWSKQNSLYGVAVQHVPGYDQILVHEDDRDKTTFMMDEANYRYNVMSFDLKNAGARYQRMMNKVFKEKIWDMLEVYMDDMII
ncbi:hypothetical protein A2U01_0016441, partial [Trifolium medium]|nr:hypothetical protein [Trifolium medium]